MKSKKIITSVLTLACAISMLGSTISASAATTPDKQTIQHIIVLQNNEKNLIAKIDVVSHKTYERFEVQVSTEKKFSSAKTFTEKPSQSDKVKIEINTPKSNTKYYLRARSVRKVNGKEYIGNWSDVEYVTPTQLYYVTSKSGNKNASVKCNEDSSIGLAPGFYSGYTNSVDKKYHVYTEYCRQTTTADDTLTIDTNNANVVRRTPKKLLPTASISQITGSTNNYTYFGYGCGPVCATMVLRSEVGVTKFAKATFSKLGKYGTKTFKKGAKLTKDLVCYYAWKNNYCLSPYYGFYGNGSGTNYNHVRNIINKLSSGKVKAVVKSQPSTASKVQTALQNELNSNNRVIISLRENHNNSGVRTTFKYSATGTHHWVVICGYDSTYYYIADPWYKENPVKSNYYYGLQRVRKKVINNSVKNTYNWGYIVCT